MFPACLLADITLLNVLVAVVCWRGCVCQSDWVSECGNAGCSGKKSGKGQINLALKLSSAWQEGPRHSGGSWDEPSFEKPSVCQLRKEWKPLSPVWRWQSPNYPTVTDLSCRLLEEPSFSARSFPPNLHYWQITALFGQRNRNISGLPLKLLTRAFLTAQLLLTVMGALLLNPQFDSLKMSRQGNPRHVFFLDYLGRQYGGHLWRPPSRTSQVCFEHAVKELRWQHSALW